MSKLFAIFTAFFIFGVGLLAFIPSTVESSHGQAGPATTCGLGNFQNIPETVTVNTPMQFTATFSPPALSLPYTLLGRICIHKEGTWQGCGLNDGSGTSIAWGNAVTSGATYNYSFTPATEGVYKVFCSSSNANDYECRGGTPGDINSLGTNNNANHLCEGGTSSKGFTVEAAAAAPAPAAVTPAAVTPVQLPESTATTREARRRNGNTVHVDFSATDKSSSGIKEIVVSIWEGRSTKPTNDTELRANYRYDPIQNAASGTREVRVPSYIEYYAVDNQNNKENNGQGKSYPVDVTDETKPGTSIELPGNPDSYIKRQLITLKFRSTYPNGLVGAIRRRAVKVPDDITGEPAAKNYLISQGLYEWDGRINPSTDREMRPTPANQVTIDDAEPVRLPAYVRFFAIGEDDNAEIIRDAFIPAPVAETTSKVRIAESQAELESCAVDSTCQKFNYDPTNNIYSYRIKSFGQVQLFVRFISNAGNTKDQDKTTIGGTNPIRINHAALPNCSSILGPSEGLVGQNLTFTATYTPPSEVNIDLRGDIVASKNGSIGDVCSSKTETEGCSNWTDLTDSGETKALTLNFDQPGTYDVFCRAVNFTHFVECRGNSRYVNTQNELTVRACNNGAGGATRQITISQDVDAPATNISPAPAVEGTNQVVSATGKNNGDTFDITFASSDGNGSGVNATFVGVWEGKTSKEGNATYFCPTPGESKCPANWAATGGTITIKVPSFVEYNAIDRAGNNENPPANINPAKSFVLKSDDITPPTSLATPTKGSGTVKYDEDVDVNFIVSDGIPNRGVRVVFVGIWEGTPTKTGSPTRQVDLNRQQLADGSEKITVKAPFYLEYHAEDINGNVERIPREETGSIDIPGGRRAHTRSVDIDRAPPILEPIQVESKTEINNGDELTLTLTASDPGGAGIHTIHTMVYEGVSTKAQLNEELDRLGKAGQYTQWSNGEGRPIPYRAVGTNTGTGATRAKVPFYVEAQAEDKSQADPPDTATGQTQRKGNISAPLTASGINNDTDPPTSIAKVQLKARGSDNFVDINPPNRTSFGRGDVLKLTFKANDNRDKPNFSATKKIHVGIWKGVSAKEWNPENPSEVPSAGSGKSYTYLPISPSGSQDSVTPSPSPSPAPAVSPSPAVSPQPDKSTTMTYTCIDNDGDEDTNNEKFAVVRFLTPSSRYAIRVDNKTKSTAWSGCNAPESGDFCDENITQNQKEFYAGNDTYDVWYHAVDAQGNFSAGSEHITVTCPKLQKVLGVSSQTGEATETIEVEAPFYLEYHAEDINGNEENKGQTFSSFSAPLDGTAPEVSEITIENQPTDVNIGTEVDLKFTASDDVGGSGLKTIHTVIWEGVASEDERNKKITALGLTYEQAVTQWKDKVNVGSTPAQGVYLGVANNATRKAKVPFYAEARAEDNCNCVPKTGGGFTGKVTADAGMKTKQLNHNDNQGDFRPKNSQVTVKGVADPNKTTGFAAGEEVELTFTSQDIRGVRVIHTGLWKGVSTKEEAIQRAREQGKDFENWQDDPTNPLYQGVTNNGKRTATVPFYLEYVAEDINGNLENVLTPPGVDDSKVKTPGGVHAFAIEIPTVTEKIRIVEGEQGLLDTCNPATCEKLFNSSDPNITFPLSAGTGDKTIWVRFINNKRRNPPIDVFKIIRKLASTEGVSFVFAPTLVNAFPGGAQFEVAVQLNTNSNINDRIYNISAADLKLKLDNRNFTLVDFVPNAVLFEIIGTPAKTATDVHTDVHFVVRRKIESASLTGTVELGKVQLRPPASLSGLAQLTTKLSIEESTALITSSNTVGSVPIARPIAEVTLTLALASPSPSPSPSAPVCLTVLTWARNSTTRVCRQFTTSCLDAGWVADQSCAPSGSASPSPSPGVSPSPGAALACDFNKNGRYDEGDNDPLTFDDLQIWTEATLGRRSRSGITQSGFSWDADCASDPDEGNYTSKDESVDLIDLNRWLRLKQGFVETP